MVKKIDGIEYKLVKSIDGGNLELWSATHGPEAIVVVDATQNKFGSFLRARKFFWDVVSTA